jgi:hypothetical protein
MIHTDDSCIHTASAPQISGASDDLLHQLQKKSGAGAVPNSLLVLNIFRCFLSSMAHGSASPKKTIISRDGNSGMGIQYSPGIRPNGYRYGDDFLLMGGTRTRPEPRWVQDGYFFPPAGNPTGTRYFTTAIILDCE